MGLCGCANIFYDWLTRAFGYYRFFRDRQIWLFTDVDTFLALKPLQPNKITLANDANKFSKTENVFFYIKIQNVKPINNLLVYY